MAAEDEAHENGANGALAGDAVVDVIDLDAAEDALGEALFWEARHGRTESVKEHLANGAPID
mgnify:CR=1 FL=1